MPHHVRALEAHDISAWQQLRRALWPEISGDDLERESQTLAVDPSQAVFVSEEAGAISGFIEVSLRPYADGCATSPVGYIEGWFVHPHARGSGAGRALVAAAEAWAVSRGCREMASDSLLENEAGQRAHLALGYEEVERAVRFRKDLPAAASPQMK
jgi:aminoglycoside 6'-N-acetyltransferase I